MLDHLLLDHHYCVLAQLSATLYGQPALYSTKSLLVEKTYMSRIMQILIIPRNTGIIVEIRIIIEIESELSETSELSKKLELSEKSELPEKSEILENRNYWRNRNYQRNWDYLENRRIRIIGEIGTTMQRNQKYQRIIGEIRIIKESELSGKLENQNYPRVG